MRNHIFYEVKDGYGSQFGAESAVDALRFWEKYPHMTMWVSEWAEEGENLWQTTKAIDVTPLVCGVARTAIL